MRQKQKSAGALITSALLGGLATTLVLLFSDLTGARLPWWATAMAGALIGSVLGYSICHVR